VALRKVADTPVDEFGRSAAGGAGEVSLLDEPNAIPAACGIQRNTGARDPPADHEHLDTTSQLGKAFVTGPRHRHDTSFENVAFYTAWHGDGKSSGNLDRSGT
jgi:hypothetical protein